MTDVKHTYTIEIKDTTGASAVLGLKDEMPREDFEKLVESVAQAVEIYMLTRTAMLNAGGQDADMSTPVSLTVDAEVITASPEVGAA